MTPKQKSPVVAAPRLDVTGRPVALRAVDLDAFLNPKTIAVIGASDTKGRTNTTMTVRIGQWADRTGATVYPVNPNRDTVNGQPCYPTILDVPVHVDLAVIVTGDAIGALEQAIEKGAKFAVIFAAGFAEVGADGEAAQRKLAELVANSTIHLLGPNTNLNAFESFNTALDGRSLALITQSGHQGRPIFQGQEIGIKLTHWAPTGNEVDLEFADFARYFADQPEVAVIAAYIEGFKDGRTLMLAADHAVQQRKPIVCVKVGRTDAGRSMAMSHTGHLAGSDAVVSAVFRQFGVVRVDELDDLLETSAMFARTKPPTGNGVCVYAISGGTGAHMSDLCAAAGLSIPELSKQTQQQLHEWIPMYLRVSNPVDNGGPPSADWRGRKILDAIVADPNIAAVICPITGAVASMSKQLAQDLVDVSETTDKPICVIWGSPVGNEEAYLDILLKSRVPVFRTFGNCVEAVTAWFDFHAFADRYTSPFAKPVLRPSAAARVAKTVLDSAPAGERSLRERVSKDLLRAYGIPVTRDELATSAREAVKAAEAIGLPVVLKASGDFPHKSDLGLVKVGVATAKDVRNGYAEIVERAGGRAEGVLVCEMVRGGVETVVGVSHDELFGPTIMFGLGGVFIEVLRDVTFRVPPFDAAEARRMIEELQGYPLLRGARGAKPADVKALVDVIMKVQRLAVDLSGDISELDINPLVVQPKGAIALDALAIRV